MTSTLLALAVYVTVGALTLWTAGAIYLDAAQASKKGALAALVWVTLVLCAFVFWRPVWMPLGLFAVIQTGILWWWFAQKPSHGREWDRNFMRMPCMAIEGDVITIEDIRATEYLPEGGCTPRYETRPYRLSNLQGADVLILQWGSPWMCHPMFVFDFGPDGRVCISIEVRYRVGQKYSLLRSLYRQQELMFVVSDERDAILRRTTWLKGHDLYLYRVHADALAQRRFFLEYACTINSLAAKPRWYHGLTTNCTTSIYALGRAHMRWDKRMLFNGTLDRLMYDRRLLDQDMPFNALKQQSWINDIANAAPAEHFGDYIRRNLPGYRHPVGANVSVAEANGRDRDDD